jgi:hypothetical protein
MLEPAVVMLEIPTPPLRSMAEQDPMYFSDA